MLVGILGDELCLVGFLDGLGAVLLGGLARLRAVLAGFLASVVAVVASVIEVVVVAGEVLADLTSLLSQSL